MRINFLSNIKAKLQEKRLIRLKGDLDAMGEMLSNNISYIKLLNDIYDEKEQDIRIAENFVWFSGKATSIRRFYQSGHAVGDYISELNYFWHKARSNYRKVHSGLPNLICTKMPTILFGSGYKVKAEVYKKGEDGIVTEELDEKLCKKVENTIRDLASNENIRLADKFCEQATNESRDGHTFLKFSYDHEVSDYPIIEVVDIRNVEIVKIRKITKAIIFKSCFKKSDKLEYVLHEIYSTNANKDATISYELYEIKNGAAKQVSLDAIPETESLVETPVITFEGIKGMLAFEKPNKLPNSEFIDSPYGQSDYAGNIGNFDSLDETTSEIYAEIRNNKTIRYIPKCMLEMIQTRDSDGKLTTMTLEPDSFVTNYQKVETKIGQNEKNEITTTIIPDKMASLIEKWKVAVNACCTKAGISPLALGIGGFEAINAGEDSQRERNKVTLETRANKIELWKPYMSNVLIRLLEFNHWMRKNVIGITQNGIEDLDVDWSNTNLTVSFGDYITESEDKVIAKVGSAKNQGIMSLETAIDELHRDWSEEQKQKEVELIKFEQGMSLDNPMALPNLEDAILNPTNDNTPETEEPKKPEEPKPQEQPKQPEQPAE